MLTRWGSQAGIHPSESCQEPIIAVASALNQSINQDIRFGCCNSKVQQLETLLLEIEKAKATTIVKPEEGPDHQ